MRIIAYFRSSDDPHRVRDRLQAAHPGSRAALRAGWLPAEWEPGFDAVYAPGLPGVEDLYLSRGATVLQDLGTEPVVMPRRLHRSMMEHAQRDVVSVLCAGPFLPDVLRDWKPEGFTVAVNRAIHRFPQADAWVANDGFSHPDYAAKTEAIRVCRSLHADSIPSGANWFPLDHIGITDGLWSSSCALILAGSMLPKIIHLAGHDCIPGPGCQGPGTERDAAELSAVDARAMQEIKRLESNGVQVVIHRPIAASPDPKKMRRRG